MMKKDKNNVEWIGEMDEEINDDGSVVSGTNETW